MAHPHQPRPCHGASVCGAHVLHARAPTQKSLVSGVTSIRASSSSLRCFDTKAHFAPACSHSVAGRHPLPLPQVYTLGPTTPSASTAQPRRKRCTCSHDRSPGPFFPTPRTVSDHVGTLAHIRSCMFCRSWPYEPHEPSQPGRSSRSLGPASPSFATNAR